MKKGAFTELIVAPAHFTTMCIQLNEKPILSPQTASALLAYGISGLQHENWEQCTARLPPSPAPAPSAGLGRDAGMLTAAVPTLASRQGLILGVSPSFWGCRVS